MKKIITAALACAMILSSLCGCVPAKEELPPLPEKYSLLDEERVTPARNQGKTGMCSAYSTLNACESNLIINGFVEADEIDFSEGHTFYYYLTYGDERDPDSPADGIYVSHDHLEDDGSMFINGHAASVSAVTNMYANGIGPVYESVVEFDSNEYKSSVSGFHEAHRSGAMSKYMGDYLLVGNNALNSHFINTGIYQSSSIEDIKRAIIDYGAVACATTMERYYLNESNEGLNYYQGIFNDENVGRFIKHATTIIGWDDNYSRENFGVAKPEKDGAWLIQDSQGPELGDNGCYWISYEQPLPDKHTVEMCRRDDYGDILFYDSASLVDFICAVDGDTVTANVFAAEKDSALKAVGVPSSAIDQPVVIEVYRNPEAGTPDSGKRVAKLRTTIHYPGYHVIDLEKAVELSEGDTFSVVVTYRADKNGENDWLGRVPVEGEYTRETLMTLPAGVDFLFTSYAGESFVKHGGSWHDTSDPATAALFGKDAPLNNFGIKALMDNE